jgi:hypothetical protein
MKWMLLMWALAQRQPSPGCQWVPWQDTTLAVSVMAEKCDSPSAPHLEAVNNTVRVVKPGQDPSKGTIVIMVFDKSDRWRMKDAIDRRFFDGMTPRQKIGCEIVQADDRVDLGPGKEAWQIRPASLYRAEAERMRQNEPGAEVCGPFGELDVLQYFEYHPVESKLRFLFVRPGPDKPVFDPKSIRFLPR